LNELAPTQGFCKILPIVGDPHKFRFDTDHFRAFGEITDNYDFPWLKISITSQFTGPSTRRVFFHFFCIAHFKPPPALGPVILFVNNKIYRADGRSCRSIQQPSLALSAALLGGYISAQMLFSTFQNIQGMATPHTETSALCSGQGRHNVAPTRRPLLSLDTNANQHTESAGLKIPTRVQPGGQVAMGVQSNPGVVSG
jgi:hypothetical protein